VPTSESEARQRLLDLAYDVSSRLRHHAKPAVRISAALLVAAALAACDGDPPDGDGRTDVASPVAPLQQEVALGLPSEPGRYPLVERSLQRDEQGVYAFAYRPPGVTEGEGTTATASRLRLTEASSEMLEIPAQGDPILHLRPNSEVQLVSASMAPGAGPTPTFGPGGSRGTSSGYYTSYGYWRPLYVSSGVRGPAYYDPPNAVHSSAAVVDQARASTTLASPSERTFGVVHAVSGRSGGTGGGTAASSRAGVATSGGAAGGAAAAKASGFSAGAASAKGGGGS